MISFGQILSYLGLSNLLHFLLLILLLIFIQVTIGKRTNIVCDHLNNIIRNQDETMNMLVKIIQQIKNNNYMSSAIANIKLQKVDEDDIISPDNKIFVGNIDFSVTKEELFDLFRSYGQIESVHVPVNHHSGKTRGFAFITFTSVNEAKDSLALDGSILKGRGIKVNFARSR